MNVVKEVEREKRFTAACLIEVIGRVARSPQGREEKGQLKVRGRGWTAIKQMLMSSISSRKLYWRGKFSW